MGQDDQWPLTHLRHAQGDAIGLDHPECRF